MPNAIFDLIHCRGSVHKYRPNSIPAVLKSSAKTLCCRLTAML